MKPENELKVFGFIDPSLIEEDTIKFAFIILIEAAEKEGPEVEKAVTDLLKASQERMEARVFSDIIQPRIYRDNIQ